MKLEIINFKDKSPKRGKIICFSETDAEADFYFLDTSGNAYGKMGDEWEYACTIEQLQDYGHYTHWSRTDKIFDIKYDIPKDD